MNVDAIRQMIETGLPGATAQVQGDDGVHFEATVVSSQRSGSRQRLLARLHGEEVEVEVELPGSGETARHQTGALIGLVPTRFGVFSA